MLGTQMTAILTAFNAGDSVIMQVSAVIASVGGFMVYILGEASVDKSRITPIEFGESLTESDENE